VASGLSLTKSFHRESARQGRQGIGRQGPRGGAAPRAHTPPPTRPASASASANANANANANASGNGNANTRFAAAAGGRLAPRRAALGRSATPPPRLRAGGLARELGGLGGLSPSRSVTFRHGYEARDDERDYDYDYDALRRRANPDPNPEPGH